MSILDQHYSHFIQNAKKRQTLININGQILPINQANVSVYDRSFLYGDSLYEVVRTYQGVPFGLKEHLRRLEQSAALCQMRLSQKTSEYEREILKSIAAFRAQKGMRDQDVYVRIVVSRGAGKIGFGEKNLQTETLYVIYVEPLSSFPLNDFEKGCELHISKRIRNHPRALDPAMKSGNYLNSLLAFLSAQKKGYSDALLVDQQGFLTEGTTFNVFYIRRGIIATPPLGVGILDGITRRAILQCAIEERIPYREIRFTPEYLLNADEAFVSSSLKEVLPLLKVDGKKIGNGKPGKITRALAQALSQKIESAIK